MKETLLFPILLAIILRLYYPTLVSGEESLIDDYNLSVEDFAEDIEQCDVSFTNSKSIWMSDNAIINSSEEYSDLRLPGSILPRLYEISLLPHLIEGNFTTEGSVDIFVECVDDTNNITLHVDGQNIFYHPSLIKVIHFNYRNRATRLQRILSAVDGHNTQSNHENIGGH